MARNSLKNVIRLIDEVTKTLPPEQDFLNDLKRSIEIVAEKNKRKGSKSYKPSSMNCIRQMYYMVSGIDPDSNSESYMGVGICNSGTDIHQRIQKAVLDMRSSGMDCDYIKVSDFVIGRGLGYLEIKEEPDFSVGRYETKLYHKKLNMSFLCDGVIRYKGIYYILELKTENTNKFWSRVGVDPSHYNQGTAYSLSLGIPNVLFVYINRDVLDMKSFMFTPTDEMKQELIGKIETCDEYIKKLTPPPKPDDVPKKTCEYCSFKGHCRKDG